MKRLIQYYDEDFNLTYNRYKISWMLNLEIIDEDIKYQQKHYRNVLYIRAKMWEEIIIKLKKVKIII